MRCVASAVAVPLAGVAIAVTDSYRSVFLLGGAATLAALVPPAPSPNPGHGAAMTRELRTT